MCMKKVKSMVLYEPQHMEMREFDSPEIGAEDMLVKVDLVSVCGGDPIEYEGRNDITYHPPHLVEMGLDLIRPAGRYVLVSTCGFNKVPLTTDKIVFKEIELLGGLGQSWDTEPAVEIINQQKYRLDKMITQTFPLEKADEAMHFFMENSDKSLRVAIKP